MITEKATYLILSFLIFITGILILSSQYIKYGIKKIKAQELQKSDLKKLLKKTKADNEDYLKLLKKYRENKNNVSSEDLQIKIEELVILKHTDWLIFKKQFDSVYENFSKSLKEQYPSITPAELRLLMLARLGFSTKKIADTLGVSENSPRVTWSRFKKRNQVDNLSIAEFSKTIQA